MSPAIDRDEVAIHYEVTGARTTHAPLLLTHGYAASGGMWHPNLDALGRDRRVITWDIRGHGHSSSPPDVEHYSVDATIADMAAVLDAAGAPVAVLGGHSLGGYLSLIFTLRHPERVGGLVLLNSGPGFRAESGRAKWNALADRIASRFERDGLAAVPDSPEVGPGPHDPLGLALAARGILPQLDSTVIDALPELAVPALVVVGADDRLYRGAADHMAARIRGAELVVVPDAGHAANLDQPEVFDAAVSAFLARLA